MSNNLPVSEKDQAKSKTRPRTKLAKSYFKEFQLVSIRTEEQMAAAQATVDQLLTKGVLDAGEETYLDALSDLLAAFEDAHCPIPQAADADMLRHLLEAKAISQAELHRQTGIPKSTISEVLAGKKNFSRASIRVLANFFGVHPSVLTGNF